jgi:hypothetical protein
MRSRSLTTTLLVAALLAGCGGNDSTDSSPAASAAEQTEAPASDDTAAAETPEVVETSAGSEAPVETVAPQTADSGDTDVSGDGSEQFCDVLAELDTGANPMTGEGDLDPDATRKAFEEFTDIYDRLEQSAPPDFAGDTKALSDGFDVADELYARFGYDFDALFADSGGADEYIASLDAAVAPATIDRLKRYATEVCGLPPL